VLTINLGLGRNGLVTGPVLQRAVTGTAWPTEHMLVASLDDNLSGLSPQSW
jgi:hypothetical protein